jgi:2-aminobenzoate-CoA ligase
MLEPTAYEDHFARENLPPETLWPVMDYDALPELAYPKRLNAAVELLDRAVERGWGARPCLRAPGIRWSYAEVLEKANRVAGALVR